MVPLLVLVYSVWHHCHLCVTLYVFPPVIGEGPDIKHVFFNLGGEPCKNNDLCLATNKNWPPHLSCIWGPIMCELKGKTPQEGINRGQSGDRARHGGQMAGRWPLLVQSLCFAAAASGRGWDVFGSLISERLRGPHGSLPG